jgi:hypothetical protein
VTGRVVRITPNAVTVRLKDGRVVVARNALAARTPPRATVVVLQTQLGWDIVGRHRS